jgi:hypothetical protein
MTIKGVSPNYFASMPTVALDPNAHKPDPQYAQMLNQAMQNRATQAARRRENDEENVFKAREQSQQARRDRRSNEISKRNAAVNEAGEARAKSGQDFEQKRLALADTRDLIHALQNAKQAKDQAAVEFFTDELNRRGYGDKPVQPQESDEDFAKRMPGNQPPGPPQSAPVDRSPMPPRSPPPTARFPDAGEAAAAPPMKAAPAGVAPRSTASFPDAGAAGAAPPMRAAPPGASPPPPPAAPRPGPPSDGVPLLNKTQDMSWIEGKQPPPSMPPRPMASDNAQFYDDMNWHPPTEKELLDRAIADVVAREAAGLPPTARPLLPGKTLHRRAAEADQMVAPGDSLLKAP